MVFISTHEYFAFPILLYITPEEKVSGCVVLTCLLGLDLNSLHSVQSDGPYKSIRRFKPM